MNNSFFHSFLSCQFCDKLSIVHPKSQNSKCSKSLSILNTSMMLQVGDSTANFIWWVTVKMELRFVLIHSSCPQDIWFYVCKCISKFKNLKSKYFRSQTYQIRDTYSLYAIRKIQASFNIVPRTLTQRAGSFTAHKWCSPKCLVTLCQGSHFL